MLEKIQKQIMKIACLKISIRKQKTLMKVRTDYNEVINFLLLFNLAAIEYRGEKKTMVQIMKILQLASLFVVRMRFPY